MIFDTHVHIDNFASPEPDRLLRTMDEGGIDRLGLLAEEPAYFEQDASKLADHNRERLDRLTQWCRNSHGRLLPIYFINPIEPDAIDQCDRALDAGAIGFKIICETFYPGDAHAMPVYQHIADLDRAILFHSGILWDYGDNGNYNRPCNWECMFEISNLRFALAHLSWPWCDEAIALYGKFSAMADHPKSRGQKLFLDMTPGTPDCYRQDVFDKLYRVDYCEMDRRLLFGSDSFTGGLEGRSVRSLAASDASRLERAGFDPAACARILGENAMHFWGI